jgi:hypothetical protein
MFLFSIGYLLTLLFAAGFVLWIKDRISSAWLKRQNPPEKLEAMRKAFKQRILNPDWQFYEKHLMRIAPEDLRLLFSDHDILLSDRNIEIGDIYITSFEPIDAEGLLKYQKLLGYDVIPFASMEGSSIYLRPGANESNAVYINYLDGGDTEVLYPDIASFTKRLREGYSSAA